MFTFKELKSFCEKNNVRYEINPIYSEHIDTFSMKEYYTLLGYAFGMNNIAGKKGKSEWQWTWYESIGCTTLEDDTMMFFTHRYSQVNGRTYKGATEMMKAYDTITRKA